MSFDWNQFIKYCEQLKDEVDDSNRAKIRSAISRGYYGVFHKSRYKLGLGSDKQHKVVHEEFRNRTDLENNEFLASRFQNLKHYRTDADYKATKDIGKRKLTIFWGELQEFLDYLENTFNKHS